MKVPLQENFYYLGSLLAKKTPYFGKEMKSHTYNWISHRKNISKEVVLMRRFFVLAVCLLVSALLLVSCSSVDTQSPHGDGKAEGGDKSTAPIRPAEYAEGDLTYELSISDGYRTVTLKVERVSNITTASVTGPQAMTGVSVIYDAAGMRLSAPEGEELALTPEAARGLAVFFDVMGSPLAEDSHVTAGKYAFDLDGYSVTVVLDENGYPCLIELIGGGIKRCAEVKVG